MNKLAKQKFDANLVTFVDGLDVTPTKKYTYKMCQFIVDYDYINQTASDLTEFINKLKLYFNYFDRFYKNLELHDIFQYKTFNELQVVIDEYFELFDENKTRRFNKVNCRLFQNYNLQRYGDYYVHRIDNFEQSAKYSGNTPWCITKTKDYFDSFTSNGQLFYYLLRKDFEDVERESIDRKPLNTYGLSMIAVKVERSGKMSATSRWNHDNGGNEDIFHGSENTKKMLNKLLSVSNSEQIFKPFDVNISIINHIFFQKVGELLLKTNTDINRIFPKNVKMVDDGLFIVKNKEKYNFIKNRKFLFNLWFDDTDRINKSSDKIKVFSVTINKRLNFFTNENYKLISKSWFYDFSLIVNDYIVVSNGKFEDNILSIKTGKVLLKKYVYLCELLSAEQHIAVIKETENSGSYVIDLETLKILDIFNNENVKFIDCVKHILIARLEDGVLFYNLKRKANININYKIKEYYLNRFPNKYLIPILRKENNKVNILNIKTQSLLFTDWFDEIAVLNKDLVLIRINNKWNFRNIHTNEDLCDIWFDSATYGLINRTTRNNRTVVDRSNNLFEIMCDNKWNIFNIETREFKYKNWLFSKKALYI